MKSEHAEVITPKFVKDWNDEYDSFGVKVGEEWWNCKEQELLPLFKKGVPVSVEYNITEKGKKYINHASKAAASATNSANAGNSGAESPEKQTSIHQSVALQEARAFVEHCLISGYTGDVKGAARSVIEVADIFMGTFKPFDAIAYAEKILDAKIEGDPDDDVPF